MAYIFTTKVTRANQNAPFWHDSSNAAEKYPINNLLTEYQVTREETRSDDGLTLTITYTSDSREQFFNMRAAALTNHPGFDIERDTYCQNVGHTISFIEVFPDGTVSNLPTSLEV